MYAHGRREGGGEGCNPLGVQDRGPLRESGEIFGKMSGNH